MRPHLLASLLLLAGCGAGVPARVGAPHESRPTVERLTHESVDLEEALPQATDCDEVCGIADRICGLADRICEIAEEHPDDADAARRCAEARARCSRARADAERRCGCGA